MTTRAQTSPSIVPPTESQQTAPTSQLSTNSDPTAAPMPPPQVFDILPPLHDILTRLLSSPSVSSSAAAFQAQTQTSSQGPTQSQVSLPNTDSSDPGASSISQIPGAGPLHQQPLEIQQLAGEVATVRNRIRAARKAVEELPDVDRTIEEQKEELEELRNKISKQRAMLEKIGSG